MALCPDCRTVIPCHCHLTPPVELQPGVYANQPDHLHPKGPSHVSYRVTGQIIIDVYDLAEADFADLKDRIEEAAAAHKATVNVDGRRLPSDDTTEARR